MSTSVNAATQLAISTLTERAPESTKLANAFNAAGFKLALVGGPVRDAILGRLGNDLDFTTDAKPAQTKKILESWADAVWEIGAELAPSLHAKVKSKLRLQPIEVKVTIQIHANQMCNLVKVLKLI